MTGARCADGVPSRGSVWLSTLQKVLVSWCVLTSLRQKLQDNAAHSLDWTVTEQVDATHRRINEAGDSVLSRARTP